MFRVIEMISSIFRTILKKNFFFTVQSFPCLILQETPFQVVPYQKVNLGTTSYSCKIKYTASYFINVRETNVELYYKHVQATSFSKKQTNKQTNKKKETITFPERTSKINVMLSPILILTFLAPATTQHLSTNICKLKCHRLRPPHF